MKKGIALMVGMAGCLAVFGCSKIYPLEAVFIDGRLAFTSDHRGPESAPYCLAWVTVAEESGRIVWSFDAYEAYKDAEHCGPNFPLIYGHAPKGAKTEVSAQRLVSGRRYFVSVSAGNSYEGAFRYRIRTISQVENLDLDREDVATAYAKAMRNDSADTLLENAEN
jgi:hypothetical protein